MPLQDGWARGKLSHKAHEQAVQAALEEINKLDTVREVESVIRVEE